MKTVDRQLLLACCDMPCAWQTEGTVDICPHKGEAAEDEKGFPKAICYLYSTPGPHAESKIATTLGVSVSVIRRVQAIAMKKMQREMAGDMAFGHDDRYVLLMEQHFGS